MSASSKERPERNNSRRFRTVIIDAKGQLRLFLPLAVLLTGAVILVVVLYQVMLGAVGNLTENASSECVSSLAGMVDMLFQLEVVIVGGMIALVVLTFVLGIVYSHRIYGPKVALLRHVKSLTEGDYSVTAKLRRFDEFQDLADGLNELATALRQRHGEKK